MKTYRSLLLYFLSSHFQALRKYQRSPIPLNAWEWKTDYPATTHKNYPRPKRIYLGSDLIRTQPVRRTKFILYGQDNHKTEQNWINSLLADPTNDNVWVGTDQGLFYFDYPTGSMMPHATPLSHLDKTSRG